MPHVKPAAVIGAGAWGTALAWCAAENGGDVKMWALESEVAKSVNNDHENSIYLPGVKLQDNLTATSDMAEAVAGRQVVIFVAPSQFMRATLKNLAGVIDKNAVIVSATKGIENETLAMPVEMMIDTLPEEVAGRCCFLSGPTFAKELVQKIPTAATIASKDAEAARTAQEALSTPFFRLYAHRDVVGVEIGGAVKNVIAIAAGISDGLGFGHNTRAAIITRGLMEMTRLGVSMGADPKTFSGLSGMGDLVLTCAGDLSRNRTVGLRIGKGETLSQILDSMTAVAEGVATSISVHHLAARQGVEMPIATQVYNVLHQGKNAKQAVADLMGRELKEEFD